MFKHIYVPVDNSEHSSAAIGLAVELGRAFGARLTGCHVYAARLHDSRFRQMEYTLPERYRQETELERQRTIHESLIAMGLRLISESYLDAMARKAGAAGLSFQRKTFDGKHYKALIEDVRGSDYDLVVMGALGMGAVKDSQLGSVTERFIRKVSTDTLVVKTLDPDSVREGAILVALDGSGQSFNGLRLGIRLARTLQRRLEAVAVYDPYLHYALFKSIVGVLSEPAARVFRFKEQEQLHEEIIDSGLARIYHSHLEISRRLAQQEGVDLAVTLLAGKCFEEVLQHCRSSQPWLLILGRAGIHSDEAEADLGSNAENLLRLAPCNVLVTGGKFRPPADVQAEEIVSWTAQAQERMERVPAQIKGVARAALLRYAIEQGHTVITSKVIDEAMAIFMPGRMAEKIQLLAEEIAVGSLSGESPSATAICSGCGQSAKGRNAPARCPVCGANADQFSVLDRAAVEALAAREGGIEEEEPLPGVTVKWAADAREGLRQVVDPSLRRRAKARIEKYARSRRIPVITREVAFPMIEEAVGRDGLGAGWEILLARRQPSQGPPAPSRAGELTWTPEALARLDRVPAGFMREATREAIEKAARQSGTATVDLARCEGEIGRLRATMCDAVARGTGKSQ